MQQRIITILTILVLQGLLASCFSHRVSLMLGEAQAADILGATVVDRDAPSSAMRIGVVGIHPTVSDISYGSTAEQCGLRKGDIILKFANIPVNQTTDILSKLDDIRTFTVLRNYERLTVICASPAVLENNKTIKQGQDRATPKVTIIRPETSQHKAPKPNNLVNKQTLQNYLLNSKFDLLEKELNKLQEGFRKNEYDDRIVNRALSAFASTNPRFEMLINNWIKKYPSSAVAIAARGYHYSMLGRTSRGTAYANDTSPEKFRSMENYYHKAVADLTEACHRDQGLSVAFGQLITISMAVGNSQVSEALLSVGLLQSPGSYVIRERYLSSLQPKWGGSMENIRRFLASIEVQIGNNPELSALRGYYDYVSADTLQQNQNYQDAVDYFTKAINAGIPAHVERGRMFSNLDRDSEAFSDFNTALVYDPQDIGALEARGMVYNKMKEYELAIKDFNAAIQLDPLNPSLLLNRAFALHFLNRKKEALTDLQASLEYDDFNPYTYLQMGQIEKDVLKDFKAAKKHFKKAIELKPDDPANLLGYVQVLYYLKECAIDLPIKAYKKACSISESEYCTEERKGWVDRFYQYAKNNRKYGCK